VLGVPFWADLAVPLAVLALTVAAAAGPALRAGAMSPVQAIAAGRAPKPEHGFFAQRLLARLTGVPLHYLSVAQDSLSLPGLGDANGGAQVTAYGDGDSSRSGLALISGGWYSQSAGIPGIDVSTLFLNDANTAVGDTYTLVNGARRSRGSPARPGRTRLPEGRASGRRGHRRRRGRRAGRPEFSVCIEHHGFPGFPEPKIVGSVAELLRPSSDSPARPGTRTLRSSRPRGRPAAATCRVAWPRRDPRPTARPCLPPVA